MTEWMYENERWQREWLRVGREEREREEQGMKKGARTARFCMKRPCLLLQVISKVQMRYGQVPGKSRAKPVQAGHIIRVIEGVLYVILQYYCGSILPQFPVHQRLSSVSSYSTSCAATRGKSTSMNALAQTSV